MTDCGNNRKNCDIWGNDLGGWAVYCIKHLTNGIFCC